MSGYLRHSYNALNSVYREGAYVTIALSDCLSNMDCGEKPIVTRIVYGVIERHEEFSYFIKKLCKIQPKPVIRVILRLGMYLIKYMDNIPNYAAVNSIVELTKAVGKGQVASFINGVLKNFIDVNNDLPKGKELMAINYNMPIWLLDMYMRDYGEKGAIDIIKYRVRHTHLRHNARKSSKEELKVLIEDKTEYKCTELGFLIGSTDKVADIINSGKATVQALCSMLVCNALTPSPISGKILDVCAAPGGKSIYLSEINPDSEVLALDVYPHRVELINAYKTRMGADNVVAEVQDGTFCNTEWIGEFDAVLVDAPCSGLGIVGSNPDIVINRRKNDIEALAALQYKLLSVAANYVKIGGAIVYSTCSNLKAENEEIVTRFLSQNTNFALNEMQINEPNNGMHQYLTDEEGHEGFFLSRMVRLL